LSFVCYPLIIISIFHIMSHLLKAASDIQWNMFWKFTDFSTGWGSRAHNKKKIVRQCGKQEGSLHSGHGCLWTTARVTLDGYFKGAAVGCGMRCWHLPLPGTVLQSTISPTLWLLLYCLSFPLSCSGLQIWMFFTLRIKFISPQEMS
jgi:hypothetical protein